MGENQRVGYPDGWGRVPFMECCPQQRGVCVAEFNGCGGVLREADTLYGTEPSVRAEHLCGLGCQIRLD